MKRLWIGISAAVLIALAVLMGGRYGLLRFGEMGQAASKLPETLKEAKAKGIVLEPAQLQIDPPIPPSQNAAVEYRLLIEELKTVTTAQKDATTLATYANSGGSNATAKALLAKYAKPLKLLKAAGAKSKLDFEYDYAKGPELMLPEFSNLRNLARYGLGKAAYEIRTGNIDEGMQALQDVAMISRHSGQEPTLIAGLVSAAVNSMWHRTVRQLIHENAGNKSILDRFAELLKQKEEYPSFDRNLASEGVMGWVVLMNYDRYGGNLGYLSSSVNSDSNSGDKPWTSFFSRDPMKAAVGNKTHQDAFKTRFLEAHLEIQKIVQESKGDLLAASDRIKALQESFDYKRQPSQLMNSVLFPVYDGVLNAYVKMSTDWTISRAYLAIHQHRLHTGTFPANLKTLGTTFIDPFSKKELIYRKSGKGFILYSVGLDRTDDGGIADRSKDIVATG